MPFDQLLVRCNLTAGVERSVVDTVGLVSTSPPEQNRTPDLRAGFARTTFAEPA